MTYRFRPSDKPRKEKKYPRPLPVCLRGARSLQKSVSNEEPIHFDDLFDFYPLDGEETQKNKQKNRKKAKEKAKKASVFLRLQGAFSDIRADASRLAHATHALLLKLRPKRREKRINSLPLFAGALSAALLISVLSAGGVLFGLFSTYGRSYVSIAIPDFLGKEPLSVLSEKESEHFNLILHHEYNPSVPAGHVISQSPARGVHRRIYERDGKCTVVLTVSRGIENAPLEDLSGMDRRDALLSLKNRELVWKLSEEYSDTIPKGAVLETNPPAGTPLKAGDTVTLKISAGKLIRSIPTPDLFGKTEAEADALLRASGLLSGTISYEASSYPAGVVIRQEKKAYTAAEEGERIAYTVSAGDRFPEKTIPDLFGMTLEEATDALRAVGLVVGNVYHVSGGGESGNVISQAPLPLTPITPSIDSVDLYLIS